MRPSAISMVVKKLFFVGSAVFITSGLALGQIGYVRSDGISSVVYEGGDHHVHELSLLADGWHVGDLTAQAGAPLTASPPVPYVRSDGINSVIYQGADEHIYELFLSGGNWYYGDLTALAGAPKGGFAQPYVRSDGINSVVYRSEEPASLRHICELFLLADGWHFGDLSALAGAPPGSFGVYPYVRSDGINSVTYVGGPGNHINELFLLPDGWHFGDLTAQAGASTSGEPHPYVRSDGINSVVFRGATATQDMDELFLLGDGWHFGNLSALTGAPAGAVDPQPYVRSDGISSVVFLAFDQQFNLHVQELFLLGDGWHLGDLTAQAGAPPSGPSVHPYVRSDGVNAVVYTDLNGHVIELFLTDTGWQFEDLTALAGG